MRWEIETSKVKERMVALKQQKNFLENTDGYAVVEATILFPIMMMIFAGIVLLAMYLPTRAALQRATQYAATALATEQSDTWLEFDAGDMEYQWITQKNDLPNVYEALFSSFFEGDASEKAETIVTTMENNGLTQRIGDLTVSCEIHNYVVYKEIAITATRTIPVPVDLSFVRFPTEIPITVTSTAVVQNGDEFVRNIDIAADFIAYLNEKYDPGFEKLPEYLHRAWS